MVSQEHVVKCVTTCHWLILVELETSYIIYKRDIQRCWTVIKERSKLPLCLFKPCSSEKTSELIDLYKEKSCLLQHKTQGLFNRDLRVKALSEILEVIGLEGKKSLFITARFSS